ncbi:MAG: DUF3501 family protein, partial [Gallionella sp.]
AALARLKGIEKTVWVSVQGSGKVFAICNEDLDRETEDKTAAVHFLRFELTPHMVVAIKQGAPVRAGIDHPQYTYALEMPPEVSDALAMDLA